MSNFKDPGANGDRVVYSDLNGALLLITVQAWEHGVETTFGPADPVRADIAVLDGPHKGNVYKDTLVFPRYLIGQLRSSVGEMVLGRLGTGAAKPGQSPPWVLTSATDADRTTGEKYLAYMAAQKMATVEDYEAPF